MSDPCEGFGVSKTDGMCTNPNFAGHAPILVVPMRRAPTTISAQDGRGISIEFLVFGFQAHLLYEMKPELERICS